MKEGYCRGCGTRIQTVDPDLPGYLPAAVLKAKKQQICQRCYRMIHYGAVSAVQPEPAAIRSSIIKAIELSELLVLVVDFADLTGTLPVWEGFLGGRPFILVINKIDLVPPRTKYDELTAFVAEYLRGLNIAAPRANIFTSAAAAQGITILAERIAKETRPGARIAFLGAANAGKSSLIRQLLIAEGSHIQPTVTKFPGTTQGLSNWSILEGRNTIIDTPGLTAGDRITDQLCVKCATQFSPGAKLGQKLWGIKPGKGLILGGLCGFAYQGEKETTAIVFSAPGLVQHRTDQARIAELLTEGPAFLTKLCGNCRKTITWQTVTTAIQPQQDLAIAGLGWVSFRGHGGELTLTLPEGVRWEVRQAVVGKR
jgi:ribosome biogenesis GTPase A